MIEPGIRRFLELIIRELGADDARIEIGGRVPEESHIVFFETRFGARVVALFREPPAERAQVQSRLGTLSETFGSTLEGAVDSMAAPRLGGDARRRLDQALGLLGERAGAERSFVFDFDSPMIWGASLVVSSAPAEANRRLESAVIELREQHSPMLRDANGHTVRLTLDSGAEVLARPFAGIYVLALMFNQPVSEPIALGAILHAVDWIESLVLSLPPIDPNPGAKVIRLPTRR